MPAYTLTADERDYVVACCNAAAPAWGDGVIALAGRVRDMKGGTVTLAERERATLESLLPMPFELDGVSDRGQFMRSDVGRVGSAIGRPMTFAGRKMSAEACRTVFMKFFRPPAVTFDDM